MKKILYILFFACLSLSGFASDIEEKLNKKALTARAYFYRGNDKYDACNYEGAIKDFNKAIESDSKFVAKFMPRLLPKAYNLRGCAKAKFKLYKQAIMDYDKSIELDPRCVWVYFNRADANSKMRHYEEAIKDYDTIIRAMPNFDFAYYNRANAKAKCERYRDAIRDYDKAIELDPDYFNAYSKRGDAYFYLKKYNKAVQDYNNALGIDINNVHARSGLIRVEEQRYFDLHKYMIFKLRQENVKLISNKVAVFYKLGILKRKTTYYNIDYASLYYAKKKTKVKKMTKAARREKIIADYIKSLEVAYKKARDYNKSGDIKFKAKQYKEAVKDYSKAIEAAPQMCAGYDKRAEARLKLGLYKKAKEDFKKAKELEEIEKKKSTNFKK